MMSSAGMNVDDIGWSFFSRNSFLRLAFLFLVEGLFRLAVLGAVTGADFSWMLVAMEKLKVESMHNKLRGAIGKKKFFFLIGWRLLIFGRILMKFFVLV